MRVVLFVLGVLSAIGLAVGCPPPTLPPGGKWVPDQDCKVGNVYETLSSQRQRCHCWGRCGYICEPSSGSGGSGGGGSGGNGGGGSGGNGGSSPSPCKYGGVWTNPSGQRCRCQSFNQESYYLCEDTTSPTPASNSTNSTTPTSG